MPTLEELLRTSLSGVTEKFQRADNALHAAVAETAAAVQAVTEGKATLRLLPLDRTAEDTRYELDVYAQSRSESREMAILLVPSTGFPIQRLEADREFNAIRFRPVEAFQTGGQLSAYFKKLVSDQDSPLVTYLAYLVRTTSESDAEDQGKIPF